MRKDSLHLQPRGGVAFTGEQTLRPPGFLQKGIRRVLVSRKIPVVIEWDFFVFISVVDKNTVISWYVLKGGFFYSLYVAMFIQ